MGEEKKKKSKKNQRGKSRRDRSQLATPSRLNNDKNKKLTAIRDALTAGMRRGRQSCPSSVAPLSAHRPLLPALLPVPLRPAPQLLQDPAATLPPSLRGSKAQNLAAEDTRHLSHPSPRRKTGRVPMRGVCAEAKGPAPGRPGEPQAGNGAAGREGGAARGRSAERSAAQREACACPLGAESRAMRGRNRGLFLL